MSGEVLAHPAWTLCQCSFNVATVPYLGSFICNECAETLRTQRTLSSAADVMLAPSESTSLDDLLRKLVSQ